MTTAERYHDISCGHRVVGHENKCRFLHGHNYRITFTLGAPELDSIGRVLDFSVIKEKLCMWLEDNYDHKFLVWEHDPMLPALKELSEESLCITEFNPTAENIAQHLMDVVAVEQLAGTGCVLVECKVEETRKCSATVKLKV
jgi:6-pyruvoyltetrahydropterin/6-carboxytetrahydropterin synthase